MQQAALSRMREVVGLWYVGHSTAGQVVYAACDLLAVGFDGPSLCMLAAVPIDQADVEVPDLLEPALNDVGLTYYAKGSLAAQKAGLFAIVARTLSNRLRPQLWQRGPTQPSAMKDSNWPNISPHSTSSTTPPETPTQNAGTSMHWSWPKLAGSPKHNLP